MPIIGKFNDIHPSAKISDTARICGWCYIGPDVVIGDHSVIGNFCEINSGAKIGSNTLMNAFCILTSNTIIGNNVILGGSVITADEKYMTARTKNIQKKPCTIGDDCRIGMAVRLVCTKLDDHVSIGANSVVLEPHIGSYEVWVGTPARFLRKFTDYERSI